MQGPEGFSERPSEWDLSWLSGAGQHSGTTFEIAGSVGVALIVIAVCLVAEDRLPVITFPVAAVRSMALAVYTGSVMAIRALGTIDYDDNRAWLVYVLVTLVIATVWRLVLGRGPLERLLTWSSTRVAGSHVSSQPANREASEWLNSWCARVR
jgi:hypothetical protein